MTSLYYICMFWCKYVCMPSAWAYKPLYFIVSCPRKQIGSTVFLPTVRKYEGGFFFSCYSCHTLYSSFINFSDVVSSRWCSSLLMIVVVKVTFLLRVAATLLLHHWRKRWTLLYTLFQKSLFLSNNSFSVLFWVFDIKKHILGWLIFYKLGWVEFYWYKKK